MTAPTTRETADHAERSPSIAEVVEGEVRTHVSADHTELARRAEDKANAHIRNLRLAASRDFAVSGYSDGLIVEQDMRGMLLAAAEAFDALLSEIAALRGSHKLTLQDGSEAWCSDAAWRWFQEWAVRLEQAERQRDEARDTIASTVAKADWMQGHLSGERSSIDRETIDLVVSECRAYCYLQALANQGADQ